MQRLYHKLPKKLRLNIFGNEKSSGKSQKVIEDSQQLSLLAELKTYQHLLYFLQ